MKTSMRIDRGSVFFGFHMIFIALIFISIPFSIATRLPITLIPAIGEIGLILTAGIFQLLDGFHLERKK